MGKKIKKVLKFDMDEKRDFLMSNFKAKKRRQEVGRQYA